MKYLAISLAVSIGIGLLLFGISYPLLQNVEMSEGLAAIPIIGSHHIAEMLERQEGRRSLAPNRATAIHTLKAYEISWYVLAAYGIVILVAVVQLAGGIVGLIMGLVGGQHTGGFTQGDVLAIAAISIPTQLVGGYFVGRWIGTRSAAKTGIAAVLVCAIATAVISRLIDMAIISPDDAQAVYGGQVDVARFLNLVFISFIIFGGSTMLGYWRGTTRRLNNYMSYLLGVLPADTRDTLVNLAYEEAEKVGARTAATTAAAAQPAQA